MSDETPVEPLPGPLDEAPYVRLSASIIRRVGERGPITPEDR